MLWMRDRSGRSGRRRGSQKPGTTTARDGAALSGAAAAAGRSPAANHASAHITDAPSAAQAHGPAARSFDRVPAFGINCGFRCARPA